MRVSHDSGATRKHQATLGATMRKSLVPQAPLSTLVLMAGRFPTLGPRGALARSQDPPKPAPTKPPGEPSPGPQSQPESPVEPGVQSQGEPGVPETGESTLQESTPDSTLDHGDDVDALVMDVAGAASLEEAAEEVAPLLCRKCHKPRLSWTRSRTTVLPDGDIRSKCLGCQNAGINTFRFQDLPPGVRLNLQRVYPEHVAMWNRLALQAHAPPPPPPPILPLAPPSPPSEAFKAQPPPSGLVAGGAGLSRPAIVVGNDAPQDPTATPVVISKETQELLAGGDSEELRANFMELLKVNAGLQQKLRAAGIQPSPTTPSTGTPVGVDGLPKPVQEAFAFIGQQRGLRLAEQSLSMAAQEAGLMPQQPHPAQAPAPGPVSEFEAMMGRITNQMLQAKMASKVIEAFGDDEGGKKGSRLEDLIRTQQAQHKDELREQREQHKEELRVLRDEIRAIQQNRGGDSEFDRQMKWQMMNKPSLGEQLILLEQHRGPKDNGMAGIFTALAQMNNQNVAAMASVQNTIAGLAQARAPGDPQMGAYWQQQQQFLAQQEAQRNQIMQQEREHNKVMREMENKFWTQELSRLSGQMQGRPESEFESGVKDLFYTWMLGQVGTATKGDKTGMSGFADKLTDLLNGNFGNVLVEVIKGAAGRQVPVNPQQAAAVQRAWQTAAMAQEQPMPVGIPPGAFAAPQVVMAPPPPGMMPMMMPGMPFEGPYQGPYPGAPQMPPQPPMQVLQAPQPQQAQAPVPPGMPPEFYLPAPQVAPVGNGAPAQAPQQLVELVPAAPEMPPAQPQRVGKAGNTIVSWKRSGARALDLLDTRPPTAHDQAYEDEQAGNGNGNGGSGGSALPISMVS